MSSSSSASGVLLTVGVLLAVGCRGPTVTDIPGHANAPRNSAPPRNVAKADDSIERRTLAHAHYAAGVVHDLNNERDLALEEYRQAALSDPDDETLILEVTRRFLENKHPEKAVELLLPAAAKPRASGAILARLGLAYSQLGQSEKAIESNRAAMKREPQILASYQNLFLTYLQNKQADAALKILDDAANQAGADADFLLGVGELYAAYALQFPSQRESVHAKGVKVLNRVRELELASPQTRLKLADGFNLFGDTESAARLYLTLLEQLDNLPMLRDNVRAKLADIFLRKRDRKRAAEQLEAIVKEDPTNVQAYYFLGTIAYEESRWAAAVEYWQKAILLSPDFEQAHYDLASAQIALGTTSDALATLDQARGRFAASFVSEYLTGVTYNRDKSYPEAIRHFAAAETIAQSRNTNQLTQGFYFQFGATCERSGDRAQAEKYFEKCLQLAPDFPEALNYLGYMWAEQGEHLEKARDMIERALKAEPKNEAYLDSMGWVLFKLNQPKEALEFLLKAVAAAEQPDATLFDHLGDIYIALKQPDKAREAWEKSLSVEKNEQVKKKLEGAATR